MKTFACIIFLICLNTDLLSEGGAEFTVRNMATNVAVSFKVYPVSMVFNHIPPTGSGKTQYNLLAGVIRNNINDYINGRSINEKFWTLSFGDDKTFEFDRASQINTSVGTLGYGRYRFEFWFKDNTIGPSDDYVDVEFDYNHGVFPSGSNTDLSLEIIKISGVPKIYYRWVDAFDYYLPVPSNRLLEGWHQLYPNFWREKNFGDFKYNTGDNGLQGWQENNYNVIPQDPRRDCVEDVYSYTSDENQFFNFAYTDPLTFFDYYGPADVGVLTLKLTIEKSITTPDYFTFEYGNNAFPIILPSPIVITNGASLILSKGNDNNTGERRLTFKQYREPFTNELLNLNTPLVIDPNGTLELQGSTNPGEIARVIFEPYSNSEIDQYGIVKMGDYSKIDVLANSYMKLNPHAKIIQYQHSLIFINGGTVHDCGADYTISERWQTTNGGSYIYSPGLCNYAYNPENEDLFTKTLDSGAAISIASNSTLTLGDNCKFVFDGAESHLKLEQGSTVKLGSNASIEFRNGAYIDANGCTFTSINSGEISSGVKLIGAGSNSIIQNCTFNDANISIDVQNTSCTLLNNTINIPTAELGAVGINTSNVTSITIQHNTINIGINASATGINMLSYDGDGLAGGIGVPTYALNVINNFINGGSYPLSISCLTANRLPFLIKGNTITPLTGITNYGIFAYNISGNIKNNIYSNNQAANSLALQQSDVNLFDNSFLSGGSTTLLLQSGTTARMAPIQDENGQWLWIGGNNSFNSNSSNNIGFTLGSNPIVSPFGSNCFYLGTMPNYFISGEFCGGRSYNAYENYWEPTPTSGTYNILCSGTPQYVNYTPYYTECPMIIGGTSTGYVVEDAGNGIYDTVYTSPGEGGEGGSKSSVSKKSTISEGRLYYEALTKRMQHDYAGAIGKCKDIINSSDTSDYYISALSELYLNYQQSDTIDNQNITSGLFNNLKTYLEQKMAQYANNPVFVEKAYKFVLMCLVKSKNYTEALAGYENIMNNHPDPITRLNASWDRSAVVLLMGQGGSASSNFKKGSLNRLLDYKPSHRIAKDVFKSAKENGLAGNERSSQRKYTQEEKSELNNRIEKYNPISNKDLKEKLLSDIRLVNTINSVNRSAEENNTLSPRRFTLYQNYPNPFNPSTMIKYDIPKDAVVKVKVYDILGKQVFGLDEFKKAGSYEVRFDGANLASGMYFYSIEANGFKETKKMVLLK